MSAIGHQGVFRLNGWSRQIHTEFQGFRVTWEIASQLMSYTYGALTLSGATFQWTWARSAAEDASPDYNSDAMGARFSSWAIPGSLAVTRGILVSFFSSAY